MIEITGIQIINVKGDSCTLRMIANVNGQAKWIDLPFKDDGKFNHLGARYKTKILKQARHELRKLEAEYALEDQRKRR
jgi:hypothetical protein